jgi:hypothetical protein
MSRLMLLSTILLMAASPAVAQGVCHGAAPAPGASIHGPVLEIPDGKSLCIALNTSPDSWVRVDVAQLNASRPQLMAAAFARNATCQIGHDGGAVCTIDGEPLAARLQQPWLIEAAMAWR